MLWHRGKVSDCSRYKYINKGVYKYISKSCTKTKTCGKVCTYVWKYLWKACTAHTRMQASLWFFTWRGTIHLLWHRGERSDCSRCHLCNWWLPIRKQKHPRWFCKYKYKYKYRVNMTMTADPKMVAWCWFINQEQDRKCGIVVCDAVLCEWR